MASYYDDNTGRVATPQFNTTGFNQGIAGIQRGLQSQMQVNAQNNSLLAKRNSDIRARENQLADIAAAEQKAIDRNLLLQDTLQSPIDTQLTNDVNQKYAELNSLREAGTISAPDYEASLSTLNRQLVQDVNQDPNVLNRASNAEVSSTLRDRLLATGKFTPEQAQAYAVQRAGEISPIASQTSVDNQLKAAENVYKQRMKALGTSGSSGGVSVDSEGRLTVGDNVKTVTSKASDVEGMESFISDLSTERDLSGWFGKKFLGNNPATRTTIMKYVDVARKNKVDDAAIMAELQSSVKDNLILDDSIDISINEFVNNAKLNATKGSRTTTKGGSSASADRQSKADELTNQYLQTVQGIQGSRFNSGATQKDLPSVFFKSEGTRSRNLNDAQVLEKFNAGQKEQIAGDIDSVNIAKVNENNRTQIQDDIDIVNSARTYQRPVETNAFTKSYSPNDLFSANTETPDLKSQLQRASKRVNKEVSTLKGQDLDFALRDMSIRDLTALTVSDKTPLGTKLKAELMLADRKK